MSDGQKASLGPEVVLAEMKKNGVTHVVWLPDSETNWLYLLMNKPIGARTKWRKRSHVQAITDLQNELGIVA